MEVAGANLIKQDKSHEPSYSAKEEIFDLDVMEAKEEIPSVASEFFTET